MAAEHRAFVQAFLRSPLERFIKGTTALPGVDHTEALTDAHYPAVGSIRLVVLRDRTTAHEEVLACDERHLRYWVTQYTTEAAKPLAYGLGEFAFEPKGAHTTVTWRYSFKLRSNRFPGFLGGLGRSLFRSNFVERDYAEFMKAVAVEIQDFAAHEVAP